MKIRQFHQSATSSLRYALLLIFTLSVLQAGLTLSIESTNLKDASMINVAGSLRMQSYRIAYQLQRAPEQTAHNIDKFEASLFKAPLTEVKAWYYPTTILNDYHQVVLQWQRMRSLLEQGNEQAYNQNLVAFVSLIDRFVLSLQNYSEAKIRLLFLAQIIGLGAILMICAYLMNLMRVRVVEPLHQLMAATEQVKARQFDSDFAIAKDQEIGALGQAFQHMSKELKQLYLEMENQVNQKTQELAKANQTVSFLYNISQQLSVADLSERDLIKALDQLIYQQLLRSARLELHTHADTPRFIYSTSPWTDQCDDIIRIEVSRDAKQQIHLEIQKNQHVDMVVLDSFAFLLGQAIKQQDIRLQTQRMALMEERGVIARELHDSIAQSLSFLRIQCTLLKRAITQQDSVKAQAISQEIDLGVANTYKQLRELLSTFRLKVDEANLSSALEAMLTQLKPQTEAEISLHYEINDYHLNAGQYIHILQIVRESVLNAIKHANATHIDVKCHYHDHTRIQVEIRDDGIGMPDDTSKLNHYGLNIMKERAAKLQGQLDIMRLAEQTCICLHFPIIQQEAQDGAK
ncbi:nitrate/nitrite two-component system sensor histidine kinase NarQ [Motilimonas eburnea]|uniref:nitrate/nitrite two-component system sensor histidine kinase NarQ n=1 Tax=Motilimonas eburnea TaxID=1737488 RepID=UPI001E316F4E|nr:nitrate/nitrite two-component system sensor histidine kinase NarQ [Motilimonas eburnea]MCE2570095.1 nitrate/nitrite two-component system sensor histidine kinase NarQ [Motilimonas eburnea]